MQISYNGGLFTFISLILLVLKLADVISVSWWIVALPFALDLIIWIILVIKAFATSKKVFNETWDALKGAEENKKENKKEKENGKAEESKINLTDSKEEDVQ